MNLRATVRGWAQRPSAYLGSEWNRMAPRERRLVAGLIGAVVAFAVLVSGFLFFETVHDISETGAKVTIEDPNTLPAKLRLAFSRDARTGRKCEVVWRRGKSVGIKFVR